MDKGYIVALIGLTGVLVGAVVQGFSNWLLEKSRRRHASRVAARAMMVEVGRVRLLLMFALAQDETDPKLPRTLRSLTPPDSEEWRKNVTTVLVRVADPGEFRLLMTRIHSFEMCRTNMCAGVVPTADNLETIEELTHALLAYAFVH